MAANDVKIVLTAQDSTQGAFASARRGLEGIKEQASSLQAGLAGLGAALAGSVAVVHIKGAIDTLDQLDDLAEKTGIAAEQLSILRYAGEVAGTPLESLAKGIQKLSINMAAAAGGSKEQQAAFDALGVSLKGVGGAIKGSDQVLGELANKFASFRDGPEKAALAVELFGKAGADLIPVLNKGEAGIAALGDEAKRFGLVVNGDLAAAAGAFNDNVKRIHLSTEAAYQTIAGQLLPTLNELAQAFLETNNGSQSAAAYIGQGLKTTLETVAVVGANVSFVLKTIGTEAGAIAAQIVALGRLDLDGFNAISEAVKADAQRARTELDALERRILGITSNAGAGRGSAADPRALGAVQSIELQTRAWREAAPVIKKAGDAAKETADEFERLYAKITGKDAGIDADFGKNIATLNKALAQGKLSLEQYIDVVTRYANQQPRAVEAVKAATKAAEDRQSAALKEADAIREAMAAQDKAWSDSLAGVTGRIQALRDEETAAQLSDAAHISLAEAVEQVAIARLQEKQAGFIDGGEGYLAIQREIDARRELLTVIRGSEARKAAEQSAKDAADAWQRTADQIGQSLTDQIMAGGKNGAEYLRNLFRTLVLRPTIEYAARSLVGAGASLLGVGTPATAQAGNLLSGLGNISSLGSAGASILGGMGGAWGIAGNAALASTIGITAGEAAAAAAAAGVAGGASAATAGISASLGSALGPLIAAAPYLAAVAGIYMLAKQLDHSGTPHTGAGSGYSAAGGLLQASQGAVFNSGFTGINYSATTEQMTTGLVQSIVGILDSTATTFGKEAGYMAAASFADDASKDGAWGSLFIRNLQGVLTDWQAGGQSFRTFSDGSAGSAEYLAAVSADVRKALDGIGLPDWAEQTLNALGESPSLDQLAAAVATINATQVALDQLGQTLRGFTGLGDAATAELIKASGGIEALAANAAGYYQAFYTEAERADALRTQMNAALGEAGVNTAQLTSRGAFREYVEYLQSIADTQPGAAAALAAMFKWSDEFASLTPVVEQTTGAIADAGQTIGRTAQDIAKSIASLTAEGDNLRVDLLAAQGDTAGAAALRRALDTAGLTEAEVALYDYNQALREQIAAANAAAEAIQAAQDSAARAAEEAARAMEQAAADAARAAIAAAEEAARAAEQAAAAAAQQRGTLSGTLLGLLGDTAALRAREIAALDPANRALQSSIYAIQDIQAALGGMDTALQKSASTIGQLEQTIAGLAGTMASASAALNRINVAGGGADATESTLWASLNAGSGSAADRLALINQLTGMVESSIGADTSAAQTAANDAAAAWAAANTEAQQAASEAAKAQQDYWKTEIDNAQKLADIGQNLRDYLTGLQTGALSALTPAQQMAAAQAEYAKTLAAAQGGDVTAAGKLQGAASTYLEQARGFDPGSYAQVFDTVTGQLSQTAGAFTTDAQRLQATAQQQLATLGEVAAASAATQQATEVATVISAENAAKLEALRQISGEILAQAAIDKAAAEARLTEEKATQAKLEADRTAWQGLLLVAQQQARDTLATLPTVVTAQTDKLVAEIAALRAQIEVLQQATTSGLGAVAQVTAESSASNAAAVSGAVTQAVFAQAGTPEVV